MTSTTIYLPSKIKVGYQNREDTYTGKLAYIIYYDQRSKLIHAANLETLILLAIKLHLYNNAAKDLGISTKLGGYSLQDWLDDVLSKSATLDRQGEESRLKSLEATLHELLSAEKKTELLIEDLTKELL